MTNFDSFTMDEPVKMKCGEVGENLWEPEKGVGGWIKLSGAGSYSFENDGLHLRGENKLLAEFAPSIKNGEMELTFNQENDNGRIGFLFRVDPESGVWQNVLHDDDYEYARWYYKNSSGTRNYVNGDGSFMFSRAGLADTKLKFRFWGTNKIAMWMDDYVMFEGSVRGMSGGEGLIGISTESVSDIVIKKVVCRSLQKKEFQEEVANTEMIEKGELIVSLAKDFPRVIDYTLNGKKLYGSVFKHNVVSINATDYPATAKVTKKTSDKIIYHVAMEKVNVTFDVVFSVAEGNVLDMRVRNIDDSEFEVRSIGFPSQPLLSAKSTQPGAKLDASVPGIGEGDHNQNPLRDCHYSIADGKISYDENVYATLGFITTDELSASMENNVLSNLKEFRYKAYRQMDGTIIAGLENNDFMYRGLDGKRMYPEEDLYCKIVLTEDTNGDDILDWQDGANALKTITSGKIIGGDKIAESFFHIAIQEASQVNVSFLQLADNMKRMSNCIDGFNQIVEFKGYANEGHDCGHADYDDISVRAGGAEDMQKCVEILERIHSVLGVHINHTEAYPEAKMFNYQVMSSYNGWKWFDQSKFIRRDVDIMNGGMDKRLNSMFEKVPGIGFVYVDTYGDDRWAEARIAQNLVREHGVMIGTENKTNFDRFAAWVHWPGIGDSMHRFVYHQQKDVYTASCIFRGGYSRSISIMGWQKDDFYGLVEQFYTQQLPQRYLMKHDVRKWTFEEAIFEGNVKSTSRGRIYKDGNLIADGSLIFIPWFGEKSETKNPDEAAKIYHWNPNGGETTWMLPEKWKNTETVKVYQTSQNGKKLVEEIKVKDGKVTVFAKAKTPYVLYKGSEDVKADVTKWSEGSLLKDTGFNSRDFSVWKASSTAGSIGHIKFKDDSNGVSILTMEGEADGTVTQTMTDMVPGKKYRLSVWAGAENGKTARLTVTTPDGKKTENYTKNTAIPAYVNGYPAGKKVQRIWVDFVQPENEKIAMVTLSADASKHNGKATFMESRIVKTDAPELPKGYAAWEDFEHVEQAFGVFVSEVGGTVMHLSETHKPYTEDTINGNWSLKNYSKIRTQPSTVRILPNTEYMLEFVTTNVGTVYVESESDGTRILEKSYAAGKNIFRFVTDEKEDYIVRLDGSGILDDFKVYHLDDQKCLEHME